MMISTGVLSAYVTNAFIEKTLQERAESRGLKILPDTIEVSIPAPGMKVATCECEKP